jgi:hypothetical protein
MSFVIYVVLHGKPVNARIIKIKGDFFFRIIKIKGDFFYSCLLNLVSEQYTLIGQK